MSIQDRVRTQQRSALERARSRYKITRRDLAEQPTAVVRSEIAVDELGAWIGVAHHLVAHYLLTRGTRPAGPPFARVVVLDGTVAVEAGYPVAGRIEGDGDVEASVLPNGTAAVITHVGRYEGLESAYEALAAWLSARGHAPAGPAWEVYSTDPNAEPDPGRWRTDVVLPYRRHSVRRWRRR